MKCYYQVYFVWPKSYMLTLPIDLVLAFDIFFIFKIKRNMTPYPNVFSLPGPKQNTIIDMWSMVWQTEANRIVMVTNLCEGRKVYVDQQISMLVLNERHVASTITGLRMVVSKFRLTEKKTWSSEMFFVYPRFVRGIYCDWWIPHTKG